MPFSMLTHLPTNDDEACAYSRQTSHKQLETFTLRFMHSSSYIFILEETLKKASIDSRRVNKAINHEHDITQLAMCHNQLSPEVSNRLSRISHEIKTFRTQLNGSTEKIVHFSLLF
jgi:hypothetical protein